MATHFQFFDHVPAPYNKNLDDKTRKYNLQFDIYNDANL